MAVHGRKNYTVDDIFDAVMPIAERSNVKSVFVSTPKKRLFQPQRFDVIYYPYPEFTLEDKVRMDSIPSMFPPGICTVYETMFDRVRRDSEDYKEGVIEQSVRSRDLWMVLPTTTS